MPRTKGIENKEPFNTRLSKAAIKDINYGSNLLLQLKKTKKQNFAVYIEKAVAFYKQKLIKEIMEK